MGRRQGQMGRPDFPTEAGYQSLRNRHCRTQSRVLATLYNMLQLHNSRDAKWAGDYIQPGDQRRIFVPFAERMERKEIL